MVDSVGAHYVRQSHFDSDRMAGSVAHWKAGTPSDDTSVNALSLANSEQSPNITAPTLSFGELLDIVNPLQHMPIVNNIYRDMTGDKISPVAQIIGGGIYGGGLGAVASIASAAVQEHSGEDGVTSALLSSAKSEKSEYAFIEDERSAGMNKTHEPKIEIAASVPATIEVASAVIPQSKPSIAPPSKNYDVFERMEIEKREPVTRVSIDIAMAEASKPKRQQWNLNS